MREQTLTSLLSETSLLTPVIMTIMSKELQIMHSDLIKEERENTSDEEMEDEDIDVGSNDGYR